MARSTRTKKQKTKKEPREIAFDYIKSNHFRVVRADGAIGSITPRGYFHFAFYSERAAIPRREVYSIAEGESPKGPRVTDTRGSIVREMEVDVFLDEVAVVELRDWLSQKIRIYRAAKKKAGTSPKSKTVKK